MKDKAKKYLKGLYALPPNEYDLTDFAELILNEFIEELDKNSTSAVCNGRLEGVLYISSNVDGKKSLNQIKKEFLDVRSNEDDKANAIGERTIRCEKGDAQARGSDQLNKDQESKDKRRKQEETTKTNKREE